MFGDALSQRLHVYCHGLAVIYLHQTEALYPFLPFGPLGPKGYCRPLRAPPPPHTLFWPLHQHGATD